MQIFLDAIGRAASWIGLEFNATKCATLYVLKRKAELQTKTFVQGQSIPTLDEGHAYQHLGVLTGLRIDQTPEDTIKAMLKDISIIECSSVQPLASANLIKEKCMRRPLVTPTQTFSMGRAIP
ncbi:hypothetical protein FOCC_FOCC012243 [Frankliniella occidentalis]|nr:hypothetical protein FOCC_FOCC012243 [Frankliniella occidentalis]